jgi:predicted amidohydrolase YtcJ
VASHCTTEAELVFTLAALEAGGTRPGDRIEHGGIAPDHLIAEIARLGLSVVSQPHFIAERGEQYLDAVEPDLHSALYRLQAFRAAGVTLAGGSDAPFGSSDPWAAMRAAVSRRTDAGRTIGPGEALSPEQALALYLADPEELGRQRRIAVGAAADLCLLGRPWAKARERLDSRDVRATIVAGRIIYDRIDKAP